MELVEGQTLADRIAQDQIPVDEAISIGTQIAEALEAAHTRRIVHRDLKPANVIISRDRRVKVLDFGLAKVSRSGQDDDALTSLGETQPGVILGTPAYMSPEQIAGARVDHLTDIFSLGIILHEMVTGHRPFQGKTRMELAASILRDQPPRISRPDAPDRLVAAIERCLVKSAGERMQSAGSLAITLRALASSSTSAGGERSKDEGFWVAVLPFKSTGASPELAAIAEGLTEEVAAGLSPILVLSSVDEGAVRGTLRH